MRRALAQVQHQRLLEQKKLREPANPEFEVGQARMDFCSRCVVCWSGK